MPLKAIIFLFFLSFAGLERGEAQFPSLEAPKAQAFAARFTQGNYNWRDLAEVSLWASAVNAGAGSEEKAAAYMDQIESAAAELAAADLPQEELAEYVLDFLHSRFLKSYSEHQTRIDELIESGSYNCVSSAVLYMILGLAVGLDVEGVVTKTHAFAIVKMGTEQLDVETTNPYGFNPGSHKEFYDAIGNLTGYSYVPQQNYQDRTQIRQVELVSLILHNRIADLERKNRRDAIPLFVNRAILLSGGYPNKTDISAEAWKDMMDRLINLGNDFLRSGKEDDALAWAEYAAGRFPDPVQWEKMITTAANNKLVKLIRAKKTAAARAALTAVKPKLSGENYLELDTMVLEAEAGDKINTIRNPGDAETALAFLAGVWERLPPEYRDELRVAAVLFEADRLGKARNWTGGLRWLAGAIEKYGANTELESALRVFKQNRVNQLHNEFAALFNKRNYAGAKASIEKSLQEFPGERQLVQDLALVEKALTQQSFSP